MKKNLGIACFILTAFSATAQMRTSTENDTIRIQEIEDILLHKTANPNKARTFTGKTQLSVMENPQPVSIVTHEIIEEQQSKQLSDVLQNVNGLYITSSRGNSQDSFGGRGFSLGNDNIFKNGARVNSGVFPEVTGLERVEVLKGATAMLYGNTAAGAVINMITKKPRFSFGGHAGISAGSWNSYKPFIDFYGPLSKNVAFRVNGTYEYAESFRDVVSSKKYYFNPSFLFNLGKNAQIIVEADHLKNEFTPDFGTGAIENRDKSYSLETGIPRSTFLGANWQYQDVQQTSANITYNHQLSKNWTLNTVASFQNYVRDYYSTERTAWSYQNNRLAWTRTLNKTYNEQNYGSFQANLNGEFFTGKVKHQVLIGADGDYGTTDAYTFNNPKTLGTLFLDDSSTWITDVAMPVADQKVTKTENTTRRAGVYAQDFISLNTSFKILAGLRWSYIENLPTISTRFATDKVTYQQNEVANSNTSDHAVSPKLGLVYHPNPNFSLFATYTNSFSANTGLDVQTEAALRPSVIDQFELGMKKNIWNNAVAFNISLYQIVNNNFYQTALDAKGMPLTDPRNLKEFAGKMRSRGVELDITGKPAENISLIAGFAYNNSVYLDTPANFGYVENQRLVRTPATTANFSAFYTFDRFVKGLKLGAMVYFVGDRLAGWNDTKTGNNSLAARNGVSRSYELKDYATVALSAGYEWKKLMIQAKVGNLFDVKNYTVHENYSVNPLVPRNLYVTITYRLF